jgi:hypothetical protein
LARAASGTLLFSSHLARPPAPALGEVVAVVHDARSDRPVAGATIEILTPDDAVVTTLTPAANGRARHALREGPYRVRVSHPRFGPEVRQVRVMAGHTAEVRLRLHAGPSTPVDRAERAVSESVSAVRRLFQ